MQATNQIITPLNPRLNHEFYGFENIEEFFIKTIREKKLSNAYIFYGNKGLGKATFAFRLTRYILKLGNENITKPIKNLSVSKTDKIFKSISSLTHPDFKLVETEIEGEEKKINTKELQEIYPFVYSTCIDSSHKIIIIDNVDDISTHKAKNILLKILEDCPSNCIFLLISNSISKVPSTIQSRCQKIYFKPIEKEKFEKWFSYSELYKDKKKFRIMLDISNGSLGNAIRIINQQEYFELYNYLDNIFENFNNLDKKKIENVFSYINENISIDILVNIINFLLYKFTKKIIEDSGEKRLLIFYLDLFFCINTKYDSYKIYNLDKEQLLKIIKFELIKKTEI